MELQTEKKDRCEPTGHDFVIPTTVKIGDKKDELTYGGLVVCRNCGLSVKRTWTYVKYLA